MRVGLVLTGGGARAAYQAGVLRGVADLLPSREWPFPIVTGISAGAINGAFLAARAGDDFRDVARELWALWEHLTPQDVFATDRPTLARIAVKWLADLSLGGLLRSSSSTFLLDTTPLRGLIERTADFDAVARNAADGVLHGVAVSATSYRTGAAVTFFDGAPPTTSSPPPRSPSSSRRCSSTRGSSATAASASARR
jgi:NTE family protein